MRPLAVLIGILMGSAFALFMGLLLSWITLLFLHDDSGELIAEKGPLVVAIGVFGALSVISGISFYGQVRERRWGPLAHLATTAALLGAVWLYWPSSR